MMEKASFAKLVNRRQYSDLEIRAKEYIETDDWKKFLSHIKRTDSKGKARDALVSLLKMEAVGGTDSDIFKEFSSLEGNTLTQVRANAIEHTMEILEEQIENKHTYFLDIEAMTMTPYVVLVKEVIEARKRELEQLEKSPSRIEVLRTFYGFSILMIEGSKTSSAQTNRYGYRYWRRSTWLDENLTESAVSAVRQLTGEFAEAVDMDKRYRTLGSSRIFKERCTKTTADILADAVRLTLYKVPGNRSRAARNLGETGDSRTLSFLHHRLSVEENRNVRISIAGALGRVGHVSSIATLKERGALRGRYLSKEGEAAVRAIGGIYSPQCIETLIDLLRDGNNSVKAASIYALSKQGAPRVVELIAPYLVNKSRPVVRASVLALTDLGRKGHAAIRKNASVVIKRIGSDRPSKTALTKMLSISGVGKMKSVQQYFATRFEKLGKNIQRWHSSASGRSYSYYWRRRERRDKQKLIDYIRLASSHLQPPYEKELVKSIRSITRIDTYPSVIAILDQTPLGRALRTYDAIEHQSYEQLTLIGGS
ncbi:MAG: HEAT repeat domain-containing protein [Candidatus Thorarchaeota archaeon]|jgi:hypothetical protein